jgi:hypothetical protein
MQITDWLDDDEEPYFSMRCIAGSDKNAVSNRVAFIEKTPRVRVAPYTEVDDWKNWMQGPKGCAPEYGHYQPSRDWCDGQLRTLGYNVGGELTLAARTET